jgi:hypothetical protein
MTDQSNFVLIRMPIRPYVQSKSGAEGHGKRESVDRNAIDLDPA